MSALLEKAASPKVLNNAWRKFRRDRAVWAPGIPRKEMEPHFAFHLLQLAEELKSGQYRPHPTRFFPVRKGDGGQRIISAMSLRDKVAQRAVLNVLEPAAEARFHPNSFGYRSGRTIGMAIARAREYVLCGLEWLVDADIESFFDNIPHSLLLKALKPFVEDRRMMEIIRGWLEVGTPQKGFLAKMKGIPQGSVLSPYLCNVYLNSFDYLLSKYNLPFVRFADDFLVFARSRQDAERALDFVEKKLSRLDLRLNSKKTGVVRCSPKVRFLGRKMPKIKSSA